MLVLLLSGCTARESAPGCGSPVLTDALPTWARGGFSDDGAGTPHVIGRSGDIVGVLFGTSLTAPPSAGRGNKILWVSRFPVTTGGNLRISATDVGTGATADRQVDGGPGPSIVDLPTAGCWRLTLRWSGHLDTLDLTYRPG